MQGHSRPTAKNKIPQGEKGTFTQKPKSLEGSPLRRPAKRQKGGVSEKFYKKTCAPKGSARILRRYYANTGSA